MQRSEREKHEQLKIFYNTVSEITLINDVLRLSGLPAPLIAVAVRDLKESLSAFEHLRAFSDYRTPSTIRAFIRLCEYCIPMLLSPYFAHLAIDGHMVLAFIAAGFIGLPFLLLTNLQHSLENPFAGDGDADPDDIRYTQGFFRIIKYQGEGGGGGAKPPPPLPQTPSPPPPPPSNSAKVQFCGS